MPPSGSPDILKVVRDPCGSVPRLFFALGLLTMCRKGREDRNKSGGPTNKQTHHKKGRRTLSRRLEGKRDNSNELDREQGSGSSCKCSATM
jgi:hypothetical protein